MEMDKSQQERLQMWQSRLERNETCYQEELTRMDEREKLYRGDTKYKGFVEDDPWAEKSVIYNYNIIAETIEAQVSSDIPQPKVTARRERDETLAALLENMLRNELDRMPMEQVNDIAERTSPIQGGVFYFVEWNNLLRSHNCVGENAVSALHPKWVIPQAGVYTSVVDMDYIFLKLPQTKASIKARYGVDVSDEREREPDIKDSDGGDIAEDMVTQYMAYYRNENGGIGLFSWVEDQVLEDLEDYQARRLCRCAGCGELEPAPGALVVVDGEAMEWREGDPCPECGGRDWLESEEDYEEIEGPLYRSDGTIVPGTEEGAVQIPYYKPSCYPIILQRNVSVFGRLLGESDVDKIESQQHGINRLELKIFQRMLEAGHFVTLPPNPSVRLDHKERVIRLDSPDQKSMIDSYDFTGSLEQELYQVNAIYQHARQAIGVTDSFQGRVDSTATSGKAKEFSAAQAAGRLESKRTMKESAYADLFRMLTQFRLAYADEPRPVVYQDEHGKTRYDSFSKWDFLEYDEDRGVFWWNDQFLFSCDTAAPLAKNRERMWQETVSFFQAGAFGDPTALETRISFWSKMELLHYPGASETKKNLQEQLQREQEALEAQAAVQQVPAEETPPVPDADVEAMARQAAMEEAVAQAAGSAAMRDLTGV